MPNLGHISMSLVVHLWMKPFSGTFAVETRVLGSKSVFMMNFPPKSFAALFFRKVRSRNLSESKSATKNRTYPIAKVRELKFPYVLRNSSFLTNNIILLNTIKDCAGQRLETDRFADEVIHS